MLNTVSAMWSRWWSASNDKDELSRANLTALVSIFAVLFWFLWAAKKSRKPPLPPGPRGLPLLGYLPFLGTNLHRKFEELAGLYGPIYKVWLGQKLCVVISSPSLVKEVVRDQDRIFANRVPPIAARVASYGGADIAFSSYGPDWKKLRKIFVREMLSNANLDGSYTLRREVVKNTIRNVYDKMGTPIDLGVLAFVTGMNTVMNMLWGDTLQVEEGTNIGAEFKRMMAEMVVLMGKPNVSDFFPVLAMFDLQGIERHAKKILKWVESILDSAIDKRMNSDAGKKMGTGQIEQRKDFLQLLLELKEQDGAGTSISMTQLKALLMVCLSNLLLCTPLI